MGQWANFLIRNKAPLSTRLRHGVATKQQLRKVYCAHSLFQARFNGSTQPEEPTTECSTWFSPQAMASWHLAPQARAGRPPSGLSQGVAVWCRETGSLALQHPPGVAGLLWNWSPLTMAGEQAIIYDYARMSWVMLRVVILTTQ